MLVCDQCATAAVDEFAVVFAAALSAAAVAVLDCELLMLQKVLNA